MLPVGKPFGIMVGVSTGGLQVKWISRYWDLRLRNGGGLGAVEGLCKRKESCVFPQGLRSPQ